MSDSESADPTEGVFEHVQTELNFPADEARINAFWKAESIFEKSLHAESRHTGNSKGTWVFYEGPPTANGMPHNGHVLTRAIKDLLPRFFTMRGYDVPRKAGWDTHGLPVEVEVEKDLGIHGKEEIVAYGMEPFIQKCVDSVFRYTEAWERNTELIGYWVDLDDAYVTYHQSYVESVWWALANLHEKGLLYRGHKVVWWWPQGGTALSAGEVGNSYKTVDDPSCYVGFELADEPGTFLCVWTTTPWTLPSNGFAAVRDSYDYAVCEWGDKKLIVAAELREKLAEKLKLDLTVVETRKGSDLVGKRYRPCFDFYTKQYWELSATKKDGTDVPLYWRILAEDFVTLDAGTGIVHVAPAFGEDDNRAYQKQLAGFQDAEELPLICSVAPNGHMTEEAGPFAGQYVKDADKPIVKALEEAGSLVHFEKYRHEYPFCWRAMEDPLIQLARPAWYIRTTDKIDRAIANNQQINWRPDHIKDGRFGDFLEKNVDWALSRERFWGTPLPVWVCETCGQEWAASSKAAIEAKNPAAFAAFHAAKEKDPTLNDHLVVHKPWVDKVTVPCDCGGTMSRVTEVIDCWFDSGCMPFAQLGFPHVDGSHDEMKRRFPADFISEAIDQTRGWFYSLLMVSTLVFDEETRAAYSLPKVDYPFPYKACVVLGHVSDREGKKESKSKGNYTPPDIILEKVRMDFAVVPRGDAGLESWAKKIKGGDDVVHIGREDYEGLDLTGKQADVWVYREGEAPVKTTLVAIDAPKDHPFPRRVVVVSDAVAAKHGVKPCAEGLGVKPKDVPRLPVEERLTVEDPSRPAPGADAFRWFFYSASPPWNNTRHSLTNVRLAQKDFLIKLRYVLSFFAIYANIDGFDPSVGNEGASSVDHASLSGGKGYRPGAERPLLDRWILSETALAVRGVAAKLEDYDVYEAAQLLVGLVDGLSNWYVRRSRDRFWADAQDESLLQDKLDATWTLYEVLVTLGHAMAPFCPFFAEDLYQNLVARPWKAHGAQAPSVHLAAFPEPDADVIDEDLAAAMAAVRELVSLGLQVRTDNKLRVRQPLRRADIVVGSAEAADRLRPYEALILDELNVHAIHWLLPGQEGEEVSYELKPNFRALGPRLGKKVQAVKKALAKADAGALRTELAAEGEMKITLDDGEAIALSGDEVQVVVVASDGYAAAGGRAGVVVLTTELDEELLDEGLAREVLAQLQGRRKKLDLGYTERIDVSVRGSERLARVVDAQRDTIATAALCVAIDTQVGDDVPAGWTSAEAAGESFSFDVKRR